MIASESHSKGISRIAAGRSGRWPGRTSRPWGRCRRSGEQVVERGSVSQLEYARHSPQARAASRLAASFCWSSRTASCRARKALFHLAMVSTLIASALALIELIAPWPRANNPGPPCTRGGRPPSGSCQSRRNRPGTPTAHRRFEASRFRQIDQTRSRSWQGRA